MKKLFLNFLPIAVIGLLSLTEAAAQSVTSESISFNLEDVTEMFMPPDLRMNVKFVDDNKNNILEADETGFIQLEISNKGGKADNVKVSVTPEDKAYGVTLNQSLFTTSILKNGVHKMQIPMRAELNVPTGYTKFHITVSEPMGYDINATLELSTFEYQKAKIRMNGVEITDAGVDVKPYNGNPDNKLQNMDVVRATVLLQNVGDGEARSVSYKVVSKDPNIRILTMSGYAQEYNLLGVSHSVRIVNECVCGEADEAVMGLAVLLAHEVHVIRSHDLRSRLCGQLEYSFVGHDLALVDILGLSRYLCLMFLHLQVEIVSKDLLMPFYGLFCSRHVSGDDCPRDLSGDTCGAAHQTFRIFLHDLVAHTRLLVVFSFDMAGRHNLHEVPVSVVVLRKKDEVEIASVVLVLQLVVIVSGHIDFTAYYGLDIGIFLRHLQEFLHTVHVSVVGDRQCRHFELLRSFKQGGNRRLTVENGILRMYVKMDE